MWSAQPPLSILSLVFVWYHLMAFMASAGLGLVCAELCGKESVLGNISCLLVCRRGSDHHKLYVKLKEKILLRQGGGGKTGILELPLLH